MSNTVRYLLMFELALFSALHFGAGKSVVSTLGMMSIIMFALSACVCWFAYEDNSCVPMDVTAAAHPNPVADTWIYAFAITLALFLLAATARPNPYL